MSNEETGKLAQLAREKASSVLKKLPLLGPVAWLMMQHGASRYAFVADLEWRVMPALALDQAKLYLQGDAPLAFASWALLSDDAAARYREAPHHLAPSDWKSGDKMWIIDIFAPFGGAENVLSDLRNLFPANALYQLAPSPEGGVSVLEWPPLGARR